MLPFSSSVYSPTYRAMHVQALQIVILCSVAEIGSSVHETCGAAEVDIVVLLHPHILVGVG